MTDTRHKDVTGRDSAPQAKLSRRRFLEIAGAAAAGLLLSQCAPAPTPPEPQPETGTPAHPEVIILSPPDGVAARHKVAIARANSYDRQTVRRAVQEMVEGLGGLGDVVRPGDRVAIKTNLTGGTYWTDVKGVPAVESFVTHPEVVRALGELVRDAGAGEIYIVEAVYQWESYVLWGHEDVARDIGATLIDLNAPDPYGDFIDAEVPGGGEIYRSYKFNPLLNEVDVFMTVAKMKCHWTCGVTHALKNSVGLVPAQFYKLSREHGHRSAFHGPDDRTAGYRVPRIIVELNKARPIDFALVEGIKTTEAGEGPWLETIAPVAPGVLFAGKNAVATDAVATAAQGYDPTAASGVVPFVRSDNHLELARAAGLGSNRLEEIEIIGPSIEDVLYPFRPCVA